MQGQERPSVTDGSQATARAAWDAANKDLFSILLFSTGVSAFIAVRRFGARNSRMEQDNGQQAWAALREKFTGNSREAVRAEHVKMNNALMRSGHDPDEYLYIIEAAFTRVTHQRVEQSANSRILYFKLFHQSIRPLIKLTWREETSALAISDV